MGWEGGGRLAVTSLPSVDGQKIGHQLVDDILMVEDGLLHAHHLLQHELMVDGELSIAVGQVLDLLLLGHDLLVQEIDLLCRDGVIMVAGLFTGRRRFPSNIVQRFLAVGPKLGVLELPSLYTIRILYVQ